MKREIGKLTVLMTAPILLSLVWNIYASDEAGDKGARVTQHHYNRSTPSDIRIYIVQLDTLHWRSLIPKPDTISISVPHKIHPDSLARIISDSLRVRILISERHNPNTRDLLLRPADKAIYTTSDLLLRPGDEITYIPISTTKHRPAKKEKSK